MCGTNMEKKLFILWMGAIFLVLSFFPCVIAQDFTLDVNLDKPNYYSEELLRANVLVLNDDPSQFEGILKLSLEKVTGERIEVFSQKQVIIRANETYETVLSLEVPAESGDYFAIISLENLGGALVNEERISFNIAAAPVFLLVKLCKDEACTKPSSRFAPNEKIFLQANSEGGASFSGRLITPGGNSVALNFIDDQTTIVSDRIGEHVVIVTADQRGKRSQEMVSFVVTDKKYDLFYVALIGAILVLIIIIAILIRIIYKRRQVRISF